ncbi:MAG: CoA-disulfide reductase, partial [Lachnospiraceae bacterium]|nr:CoA-disulfide reductase [Lachnospiraceae bacterium]
VTEKDSLISLAGPANKQGRIAADNIYGIENTFKGSLGSSVIKVFDMTVASTGIPEKRAVAEGIECDKVVLSPMSHAGYYPGGEVMTMKVVFEKKSLKILGAQIVGFSGVDKRIDVLATAISDSMTAEMIKELDLAYAPPYSSAKDPVNMAGFMIENIGKGLVKQFHWNEIESKIGDDTITLLDVRTPAEYNRGHVEASLHIPVDDLRERMSELDKSKPVYVMCQSGLRSYIACRILSQEGYDCYNLSGGYRFYSMVTKEVKLVSQSYPCGMDK